MSPPPDRRTLFSEENQKYWDRMEKFHWKPSPEARAQIQKYIDWCNGVGMSPFQLWLRKYVQAWKNGVTWRICCPYAIDILKRER